MDGAFRRNIEAGGRNNDLHIVYGSRIASIRAGVALPGDSSPDIRYTLADHLGGVSVSMESGGTWMNREEYMPYGETTGDLQKNIDSPDKCGMKKVAFQFTD